MADSRASGGNQSDPQMVAQDASIKVNLAHIKHKILVMSGKGGVGKSTVAANLAKGLANRGYKVGLLDVDLHGPSIPRMLGIHGLVEATQDSIVPMNLGENLKVMSIEVVTSATDTATIWRGPVKIGVIRQFISDVQWGDLDFLIVDSPPGTGDEPLSVAQTIPDAKAVLVTTPQEVSLADVRKSINFAEVVKMDILGIVENMAGLTCPHCGQHIDLFHSGGGLSLAEARGLNALGSIPLDPQVVDGGDTGTTAVDLDPAKSPAAQAYQGVLDRVVAETIGKDPN